METTPTITIGGSYRKHFTRLLARKQQFLDEGAVVLRPHTDEILEDGESVRLVGDPASEHERHRAQLDAIVASDLYYVENPGGYVGQHATGEVYWAKAHGVKVYCSEPPFEGAVKMMVDGDGDAAAALSFLAETTSATETAEA